MKKYPLVLLLLLSACSGGGDRPPGRVVLLGLDAADPVVIAGLRERGELPHFDRLYRAGYAADLNVTEPIFSPRIWTTIFTGFTAEKHGIESFTRPAGDDGKRVPVTSNLRRKRTVWDILSEAGRTVGVVGQWVTWPAEEVNGFLLSSYTWPPSEQYEKEWSPSADWDSIGLRTWPAGLDREIDEAVREERYLSTGDFPNEDRLDDALRHYLQKDVDFMNGGLYLFDERRPDFLALYMEGTDFFPHKLWMFHKYYESERFGSSMEGLPRPDRPPPPSTLEIFGPMVADTYRFADRVIGLLLERIDLERDALIVVSDHGFRTYPEGTELHVGDDRWMEMPFWHGETGIFLAAGAPFRNGVTGRALRPEDVTPILLAAAGLPVGEDMDGDVPAGLFTASFLEDHPVRRVVTHEKEGGDDAGNDEPIESPFDDEMRRKLKSLGYIN